MNGLRDLNTISSQPIIYTDDRPATITFADSILPNVSTYSGSSFIANAGSEITSIYSRNYDLTFTVNVSTLPGTTVFWNSFANVGTGNLAVTGGNGVYTVTGIKNLADWTAVHAPAIILGPNVSIGSNSFTSTIGYENIYARSWISNVNIITKDQMTPVVSSTYYNNAANTVSIATATPQVFDLLNSAYVANTYTVTVTANNTSVISNVVCTSQLGGTSTYNSTTGQLTLQGNVLQLNDQLNHINYKVTTGATGTYQLTYQLTNPLSNYTTVRTQLVKNLVESITSNANANRTFISNTSDQALFATQTPAILDTTTLADQYCVVIATTAGYFGTSSNSITANLSVIGNATSVNNQLGQIKFYPIKNISGDQQFTYTQYKNNTQQFSLTNNLIGVALTTSVAGAGTVIYANVGTVTTQLTYAQRNYLQAKITVIGGGGAGGDPSFGSGGTGGGGAGGELKELSNVNLSTYGNLTITVGGSDQTSSIVSNATTILSAAAGAAGSADGYGGGYSSPYGLPGGRGYYNIAGGGGGGRGAGGFGASGGSSTTGPAAYPTSGAGGAGGAGVRSIVNSTALPSIYCAGGGGGIGNGAGSTSKYAVAGGAGGSSVGGNGCGWSGSVGKTVYTIAATAPTTYGSGGGGGYDYVKPQGSATAGKQGVVVITFY